MEYTIKLTKRAIKDAKKLEQENLDKKAKELIKIIVDNPFKNPPPYEKLKGDLQGAYSRRINIKHRLVYKIFEEKKVIIILAMWTHYE